MANDVGKVIKEFEEAIQRAQQALEQLKQLDSSNITVSCNNVAVSRSNVIVSDEKLERKIIKCMKTLGIPAHIKGYNYMRRALILTFKDNNLVGNITTKLYPTVEAEYKTTSSRVERAIRYEIEMSWINGDAKTYKKLFGFSKETRETKPTNAEFMAMIVYQSHKSHY